MPECVSLETLDWLDSDVKADKTQLEREQREVELFPGSVCWCCRNLRGAGPFL